MAKISKILYIVTQSEAGGAQRYVFDLATGLPGSEFEAIVAAGGNGILFEKLAEINIRIFKISALVREISPLTDVKCVIELIKLIRAERPDIIHLNSSKASIVGSLASAWCKKSVPHRLIYTAHGFVFNEPLAAWRKNLYIFLERYTGRFKDAIICVTEFERQAGLKYRIAPAEKLIAIHNGIEPITFLDRNIAREKLGLSADRFVIGTIANFYPAKGLNYLVAAAAETVKLRPDIVFLLIGFGQLESQIRADVKKLDLEKNFLIFDGMKLNGNGRIYLKAFDIFALSSVKEGLPYTIIEAMQAGLPLAVTRVGGIPEIISDKINGLLVEPADVGRLAAALIELADNKKLAQQLAGQAENDARSKLSLQSMIAETEKIYREGSFGGK